MYVGLLGVLWQGGVVRPLVKKIGELKALRISLVSMLLGLIGLALAENTWALAAVAVLFSFGTGVARPAVSSLVTQIAQPNRKGGALGVSSSLESFSRSIAPIMGGWIIGGLHPNYIGWAGAAMAAVAVVLSMTVHFDSHELASFS
jgi:DHA1 family tetracycline resistance protein-like MFS transporter